MYLTTLNGMQKLYTTGELQKALLARGRSDVIPRMAGH